MNSSVFGISVVLFASLMIFCACQAVEKKRCNAAFRCANVEEPVWTTTNKKTCEVFRNGCMLSSENCDRRNKNKPEAKVIEKAACQKLCPEICDKIFDPICGSHGNETRFFSSPCGMKNYICKTGMIYDMLNEGPCPGHSFVDYD